jgi:hypothetical protein
MKKTPEPPPAVFGDDDPEDAYDATDPADVLAALIGRVATSIVAEWTRDGATVRVRTRLVVLERIVNRLIDEVA